MSESIQYHTVFPSNTLTEYTEFSQVDFLCTFENRKLELNSLRLCFDLEVDSTEGLINVNEDTDLFYDNSVGFHGVIDSITTTRDGAVIENITDYGRLVAMKTQAKKTQNELITTQDSVEGKVANPRMARLMLGGSTSGKFTADADVSVANYLTSVVVQPAAALKLDCCLNNAYTQDGSLPLLSYRKSGAIKVSLRLARNFGFLYGANADDGVFRLSNLKLTYVSRADDRTDTPVMARSIVNIKQAIASDAANISVVVPAMANGVSVSFQPQSYENTQYYNNTQLHRIPGLSQVQYLFNNSDEYITFIIKSEQESLERYIGSFGDTGSNSANLVRLRTQNAYGLGTSLGRYVDLSRQKFNIQIQSNISATNKTWLAYLYFHALLEL